MMLFMPIWYAAAQPWVNWTVKWVDGRWYEGRWEDGYWSHGGYTNGTKHAWDVLRHSSGVLFGFLTGFWLLSYIKKRVMQKIYFRFIAWLIPATWIFAFWGLIAFIIGGVQEYGKIGKNILHWCIYAAVLTGMEAIAWWQAPSMVKFYRWDSQSWWNYSKDDAPKNWPSQLGDFVDY